MRKVILVLTALPMLFALTEPACASGPGNNRTTSKIEAVKNKRYHLTRRHGPWMIMVASLRDVPADRRSPDSKGLTAQQAADQLVYHLRKTGIPAYTFTQKQVLDSVKVAGRTGETKESSYIAQQGRVAVIAGNYSGPENKIAKDTVALIKSEKFQNQLPMFRDKRYGAIYTSTPGRKGPLSRAFLVPNPLLSAKEIRGRHRDPLLVNLNADMKYSLGTCPGKYSLVIATFRGKSAQHVNSRKLENIITKLDSKMGTTLDDAAMNAWRLCEAMRSGKRLGYEENFETYVYHDRYKSLVSIGSFDSPSDPRILAYSKKFSAKPRLDPKSGSEVLAAELFAIPRRPKPGKAPDFTWLYDPTPELMEVPRFR